jgi:hypothetical protein
MKVDNAYRNTYRDLVACSVRCPLSLKGIEGDRVVLLSENRLEWIFAYLSTVSLGAVIVPLDAQLTEREVALLLANSEAKAVFVSRAFEASPQPLALIIAIPGRPFGRCSPSSWTRSPAPSPATRCASLHLGYDRRPCILLSNGTSHRTRQALQLGFLNPKTTSLYPSMHHIRRAYPSAFQIGTTVTLNNSLKGFGIMACMKETGSVMLGVPQFLPA